MCLKAPGMYLLQVMMAQGPTLCGSLWVECVCCTHTVGEEGGDPRGSWLELGVKLTQVFSCSYCCGQIWN